MQRDQLKRREFVVCLGGRPGGAFTGVTSLAAELVQKRLELLHGMMPAAGIVAVMVDPNNARAGENVTRYLRAAAVTLGLQSMFWRH